MKATEQYFHVVLSIMLYKVVLTSESVDDIWVRGRGKRVLKPMQFRKKVNSFGWSFGQWVFSGGGGGVRT